MEVSKLEATRQLFFAVLHTLQRAARHPLLGALLLYTPDDAAAGSKGSARSSGSSSAAAPSTGGSGFRAWLGPSRFTSPSTGQLAPSPACLLALLAALRKQADVFVKSSTSLTGGSEILVGSASEEREFDSVLCLSRDLEVAADTAAAGALNWAGVHRARLARFPQGEEGEGDAGAAAGGPAAKRTRTGEAPAPSSSSSSSAAAGGSRAGAGAGAPQTSATMSEAQMLAAARAAAVSGGKDPAVAFACGTARVDYTPPEDTVAAYEALLREEAYNTVSGLKAGHYYAKGAAAAHGSSSSAGAASSGGGGGASSMKRHMRVSAEMANLPSLAVNYPSSILVRQDEGSIDYLRALMTGPADTPYAGE
jgi:hypothetical protein